MFVEYEDEKSINLVTRYLKKGRISGVSSKCYLAGTNTFTRIIKSKKGQNSLRARRHWNYQFPNMYAIP